MPAAASECNDSNCLLAHLVGDVVGLTYRQGHDGEGRVLRSAGRELAAVRDEEIFDVVRLAPLVDDAVARILRHAVSAEIVGRRVGWRVEDLVAPAA